MTNIGANSIDRDEILHYAASHLGLHDLQMFHLKDTRHIWDNCMKCAYKNHLEILLPVWVS